MPQVADPQCTKCKKWVRVYVNEDRPIRMDERFEYTCPECGTRVNEALGVYSPADAIPKGAPIATTPTASGGAVAPAAPATSDVTITITCVGADAINQTLHFAGCSQVTNQVVSQWNTSVAFRDANGAWKTWRVQPTKQDAAKGLLPNNGPSTLTVEIDITGAVVFNQLFTYDVQYAEWYVLNPPNQERGVNFIPTGKNANWWKWSLS